MTFVDTRQLGVYRVEVIAAPSPSDPGRDADPTPTPRPKRLARRSRGRRPEDEPLLFAVDLFSAEESDIAPGDGARIAALGADVPPAASPPGTSRDEWWPPLVALALLVLLVEWLVYERDGARRIADAIRAANPSRTPPRSRPEGRRMILPFSVAGRSCSSSACFCSWSRSV